MNLAWMKARVNAHNEWFLKFRGVEKYRCFLRNYAFSEQKQTNRPWSLMEEYTQIRGEVIFVVFAKDKILWG